MAHNDVSTTPEGAHYMCDTLRRVTSEIPLRHGHQPRLVPVYLRLSCDLVFADATPSSWCGRPRKEPNTVPTTNDEWCRLKKRWLRLFRGVSQVGPATPEQAGEYASHAFYVTGRRERAQIIDDDPVPNRLETVLFVATDVPHRDRWIKSIQVAVDPLEKPSISADDKALRQAILQSMLPSVPVASLSSVGGAADSTSVAVDEKVISKMADKIVRRAETMDDTRKVLGIIVNSVTKGADVVDKVFVGQPFVGAAVHVVTMVVKAGAIAAEVSRMSTKLKSPRELCCKISHRILCEMLAILGSTKYADDYYKKLKELLMSVEDMTRTIERTCLAGMFERVGLRDAVEGLEVCVTNINEQLDAVESFGHIKLICEESLDILKNTSDRVKDISDTVKDIHSIVTRPDASPSLSQAKSTNTTRLEALQDLGKRAPPEVPSTYVSGMYDPERVEYKLKRSLLSMQDSQRPTAPRIALLGIGGSGKSTACMAVVADKDVIKRYDNRIVWLQFSDTAGVAMVNEAVTTIVAVICGAEAATRLSDFQEGSEFISVARDVVASESRKSGENILFVLDDVWDVKQLNDLLVVLPNRASVIVTTRLPKVADAMGGAEEIDIERLPEHTGRELLARRMGRRRRDVSNEELFSKAEEEEFVKIIMKETDRLPLALDIVGCIVKSSAGAWADVSKLLQEYSVANERFEYPTEISNHRTIHGSIRRALEISVRFLGDDVLLKSFHKLGIVPSDTTVVISALGILWGKQFSDKGHSRSREHSHIDNGSSPDGVGSNHNKKGALDNHEGDGTAKAKRNEDTFQELDNATVKEIIMKLRDNGLVNVTVEKGEIRGIRVHITVRAFALELLHNRGQEVEAHFQLLTGYGARHGFALTPGDELGWYPVWELDDDGYVHENIARHAEEACNIAVAASFMYSRWKHLRDLKIPGIAYGADVERAIRTLEAYLKDISTQNPNDRIRAKIYAGLGILYPKRREGDPPNNMESSIRSFEEALQVYTRESYPSEWAKTKMNLAISLAQRKTGNVVENIEKSIENYEDALQVYTRESYPSDWARTKMNLAVSLAERKTGNVVENIEKSIENFEDALQVYTRESYPSDWALTKMRLAISLAQRKTGNVVENIEKSIENFEDALQVYTRESYPSDWARTKMNLAVSLAERKTGNVVENIEKSIENFEDALQVYTRESYPSEWASTKMNLALSLQERKTGNVVENIEKSIENFEDALQVYTRESYPSDWARTKMNLAVSLQERKTGNVVENIEKSIKNYEDALQVYTRESYPSEWASTKMNLAITLRNRKTGNRVENIGMAMQCCEDALSVFNEENFRELYANTCRLLDDLRRNQSESLHEDCTDV